MGQCSCNNGDDISKELSERLHIKDYYKYMCPVFPWREPMITEKDNLALPQLVSRVGLHWRYTQKQSQHLADSQPLGEVSTAFNASHALNLIEITYAYSHE